MQVKVLHLQFTDWRRMKSKQRWYQCWEALNHANKRPVQIYRQYHRMDAFPGSEIHPLDPAWLNRYRAWGIDLTPEHQQPAAVVGQEVLEWILEHGSERFRKLDIWDVPWEEIARRAGPRARPGRSQILGEPSTMACSAGSPGLKIASTACARDGFNEC